MTRVGGGEFRLLGMISDVLVINLCLESRNEFGAKDAVYVFHVSRSERMPGQFANTARPKRKG
jgi:hypothetical protein